MKKGFAILTITLFSSVFATNLIAAYKANPAEILAPPNIQDWKLLEQFSGTLTLEEFKSRLKFIFDPTGSIYPFLEINDKSIKIYSDKNKKQPPLAEIAFSVDEYHRSPPNQFRSPSEIRNIIAPAEKPLAGLRIVIDPADIGGNWAAMENRAQTYKGFGEIREGDLNLTVAKFLTAQLKALGADVFLTHDTSEPVSGLNPEDLIPYATNLLVESPRSLPKAFFERSGGLSKTSPRAIRIAAEILLTKTVEARARAEKVRKTFQPDITLVLQHNATAKSRRGGFARLNRNVFFIHGAYTRRELTDDARQRLKMLTKLFSNVTPIETAVADHISHRFVAITGFPPVRYGNSANTRSTFVENPYVVARNLALNREHDGPVVIVEPYFMNEPVTLQRLVQGDYSGVRLISGKLRPSIYREYATAVILGLLDAYGYRMPISSPTPPHDPNSNLLERLSLHALSEISLQEAPTPVMPLQDMLDLPSSEIHTFTPFIRPVLVVSLLLGASMGLFWISRKN